jgi:hypothetical protein
MGILATACSTYGSKSHIPAKEKPEVSAAQKEDSYDWQPFKGVLLRHIVANCCFSDTQNTVVLGQDNNRDQLVDKCYQLKGIEGKIYYRNITCPDNLVPVLKPGKDRRLHCRYE